MFVSGNFREKLEKAPRIIVRGCVICERITDDVMYTLNLGHVGQILVSTRKTDESNCVKG